MASFRDEINAFIVSASNNSIKFYLNKIIRMYRDNWEDILAEELKLQFPATYKDLKFLLTVEKNPLKTIVNKISLVYKGETVRGATLPSEEGSDETEIEVDGNYINVLKDSNWNSLSQSVERYTNLTNQVAVLINYRNNKIDYEMFNFDNATLLSDPEDWQKPTAFIYYSGLSLPNYEQGTGGLKSLHGLHFEDYEFGYCYYLAERVRNEADGSISYKKVYRQKFEGFQMTPVGEPEELPFYDENGDAVLPVVLFKEAYPSTELLDFTSGADKYDANISTGVNMTLLNNLIKHNSFKKLALTAPKADQLPSELISAPEYAIKLPGGSATGGTASASVLDMQANIEMFYKNIQDRAEDVAASYGVGLQNSQQSGAPSSGFAIQLSNLDLLNRRELQINLYRDYEKQIFNKTRIIYNAYQADTSKHISEKSDFFIDFNDDLFPEDENAQTVRDTFELSNNVISALDIIKRNNPDLSEAQVLEKWRKNVEVNNNNAAVTVRTPTQPSENENNIDNGT